MTMPMNKKLIFLIRKPTFDPLPCLTPLSQRGEFLPLAKGGKEGFYLPCLHNDGLANKDKN